MRRVSVFSTAEEHRKSIISKCAEKAQRNSAVVGALVCCWVSGDITFGRAIKVKGPVPDFSGCGIRLFLSVSVLENVKKMSLDHHQFEMCTPPLGP